MSAIKLKTVERDTVVSREAVRTVLDELYVSKSPKQGHYKSTGDFGHNHPVKKAAKKK